MKLIILTIFTLLTCIPAYAGHLHKEAAYRDYWCWGETEVRLPNGNRADCVTENYAIEIDFAAKYHEAIGQALDYADQTGKRPGILLIIEKENDWRAVKKARAIAKQHGIKVWIIKEDWL